MEHNKLLYVYWTKDKNKDRKYNLGPKPHNTSINYVFIREFDSKILKNFILVFTIINNTMGQEHYSQ